MPCAAAKSMYCLARSVVAPCRGPSSQVYCWCCMAHQIPTYLVGLIQEVSRSQIAHGGLRFSKQVRVDQPARVRVIVSARHGVARPVVVTTAAARSGVGVSAARRRPDSRTSVIAA